MIISRFDRLRRAKAAEENRDLPLRLIAAETGLALGTVHRLNKGEIMKVYVSTLDTLCKYFDVTVDKLIEYLPDTPHTAEQ